MRSRQAPYLWFHVIALLGLLWAWPQTAAAKTPRQRAQQLFRRGAKKIDRKQYKRGLRDFFAALRLIQDAERAASSSARRVRLRKIRVSLLYVIGRAYQLAQDDVKAYEYYARAERANPPARVRKKLARRMQALRPKVMGTVHVRTQPAGATVTIRQGQTSFHAGQTPWKIRLLPGRYAMLIAKPGFRPLQTTIQVQPKASSFWNYRLVSLRKKEPVVRVPVRRRVVQPRPFVPPQPARPKPQPPVSTGPPQGKIVAYALSGVAIIAVGLGVTLVVVGQSAFDAAHGDPNGVATKIYPQLQEGKTLQGAGVGVLAGAGVIAIVAGIVYGLTPAQKTPPPKGSYLRRGTPKKAHRRAQALTLP